MTDGIADRYRDDHHHRQRGERRPGAGPIGDQSVDELVELTFTATATDADLPANTLTFSPGRRATDAGMTIDPDTGVFTWTPTEAQGPGVYTVTVTVTDDGFTTDTETITITVGEVNVAPVLDPIGDQSVDELVELTFTATATDADLPANTLTFSPGCRPADGHDDRRGHRRLHLDPDRSPGTRHYTVTVIVTDGSRDR